MRSIINAGASLVAAAMGISVGASNPTADYGLDGSHYDTAMPLSLLAPKRKGFFGLPSRKLTHVNTSGLAPVLIPTRQQRRAAERANRKRLNRAATIYMRSLNVFPDVVFVDPENPTKGEQNKQARVLAKRKGFADYLMATGNDRQARKAALGLF